jgi:predicted outer membrane repeat protein
MLEGALSAAINVFVNSLVDSYPQIAYCETANLELNQCNFRSAWEFCFSLSSTSLGEDCAIHLPVNSFIQLNASFDELTLPTDANILIIGNNATLQGSASYRKTLDHYSEFIVANGINNTVNARRNYIENCIEGCPGDKFIFSSCSNFIGDTVLRLWTDEATPRSVSSNDDYCALGSQIEYEIPLDDHECRDYCLHVGCYGNSECSQTVTLDHLKIRDYIPHQLISFGSFFDPQVVEDYEEHIISWPESHDDDQFDDADPRTDDYLEINWYGDDYYFDDDYYHDDSVENSLALNDTWVPSSLPSSSPSIPSLAASLTITNATFKGFGAAYGGVIQAAGNLHLHFIGVSFESNFALSSGGALYFEQTHPISEVSFHVIENCTFTDNEATVGGTIYYASSTSTLPDMEILVMRLPWTLRKKKRKRISGRVRSDHNPECEW